MQKVFKIYKEDIKNIITHYGALTVVIALCIIPSLYAWFNIKASWNPYDPSATSKIKIGVVNEDEGTIFNNNSLNIGNKVIDELKSNSAMGWQFVTENKAKEEIEKGKYYAYIVIPKDFSKNITSILSNDVKKGEIIYTVNEKINAIAPKLTDKGATGVQENVNKTIVETVSNVIFTMANEVGVEIENQLPNVENINYKLKDIQSKFSDIDETINIGDEGLKRIKNIVEEIQNDIPKIKDILSQSKDLDKSINNFLDSSNNSVNNIAPTIKNDMSIISSISNSVNVSAIELKEAILTGHEKAPEMMEGIINKINKDISLINSLTKVLESLNKINPDKPLTTLIETLQGFQGKLVDIINNLEIIKVNISNGEKPNLDIMDKVITLSNDVKNITNKLYVNFDSEILPSLNKIFNSGIEISNNIYEVLEEADKKIPELEKILEIASSLQEKGVDGIEYAKRVLPKAEEVINDIVIKIDTVNDNDALKEIINILKSDAKSRSEFLSNPVTIKENKLFPIENYGSAMSPFYTVLSLWVGMLLLVSILTTEAHGEYKSVEVYFGKYLLFLTIAIIQGLIVCLGDIFLLKVYCVNPISFIVACAFISSVFSIIIYTLVSVAGNIGKVIGIILLVLQIAGSGGTFPVQLTPQFFQIINPYLPFTYAISLVRETVGGIVKSVLINDIIVLLSFIVLSIVVGIILKRPINKVSKKFIENFKDSGIGEH
ncbi:YhgE/Pip N-terminal domain protein [Clostridium bornimense]|uniref:YhgE/Pip N-terminal domain protein n=1 Tax=Clostridium bornimense TaxID=1216932 RepID=W6SEP7_9CLOT|nr:YhgE/Pip domain-containing protein [Clostridium bornimense]CDM68145.1 YhgE/Pip N-terminal domain protein [Clostridium bornimense]